jgi:putative oxidoreductase
MPELRLDSGERRTRQDVMITWILRLAVAVVFLSIGRNKFDANSMWPRFFDRIGFGQWFRYVTGVIQICAAVLVLVPRTFLAGMALLACTMAGAAAIWSVRLGEPGNAVIPLLVFIALVGIAVHGRSVDRASGGGGDEQ